MHPSRPSGQLFSGCCCHDGLKQKQVGSTGLLLLLPWKLIGGKQRERRPQGKGYGHMLQSLYEYDCECEYECEWVSIRLDMDHSSRRQAISCCGARRPGSTLPQSKTHHCHCSPLKGNLIDLFSARRPKSRQDVSPVAPLIESAAWGRDSSSSNIYNSSSNSGSGSNCNHHHQQLLMIWQLIFFTPATLCVTFFITDANWSSAGLLGTAPGGV